MVFAVLVHTGFCRSSYRASSSVGVHARLRGMACVELAFHNAWRSLMWQAVWQVGVVQLVEPFGCLWGVIQLVGPCLVA